MTARALLLAPSRGQGGGIERYVQAIECAFASQGIDFCRVDLHGSGPTAHARMLAESRKQLCTGESAARLIVAHRALLPIASLISRKHPGCAISLLCHGIEVWGEWRQASRLLENYLMRRPGLRVVAVSSFTAGVLSRDCQATILPPGLSNEWFNMLQDASAAPRRNAGTHLVTAFRLADWRDKGLPELLQAVAGLRIPEVRVTVCGAGEPSVELRELVQEHSWCTLRSELSDKELAREFATADLCVLATRTRLGRRAYGEGFGLVLIEAQVAGTPVVAPAYGGSHDAFIDGVTGVAPADESAISLARTLDPLLRDRERLAQMGKCAAEWARESFSPERYAPLAVAKLL